METINYLRDFLSFAESYPWITGFFVLILGACVGSFLNVCIYRLPRGQSILGPGSFCPHCRTPIEWYDNVPLLSYVILRRVCRSCSKKITFRYYLVELLTASIFLSLFVYYGLSAWFFFYGFFISSLIAVAFIDFEHQIIPDEITLLGILVGLLFCFAFPSLMDELDPRLGIADSYIGMLIGGSLIYATAIIGRIIFRKEAMGGGDIKLMAMMGAFLGPRMVILAFFIAPFLAAPVGIVLKLTKKAETIPYGPFLAAASLIVLLAGGRILQFIFGIN